MPAVATMPGRRPVKGLAGSIQAGMAILLALGWAAAPLGQPAGGMLVYIGTYTGEKSKGIHAFRFDPSTGALTTVGLVARTPSPSWLALHPSGRFLFAANETSAFDAEGSGAVTSFLIDRATGALTTINSQASRGADPCHLTVDRAGARLLVANYTGGNLAVLPIGPDGRLGPASQVMAHRGSSVNASRQKGPHAHSIDFDTSHRFAVSADLGADRLFVYRYDAQGGTLSAGLHPSIAATPGAGPRHVAFHPGGRLAFAINELSSTITSYGWDATRGALRTLATTSTLPAGAPRRDNSTAEIRVHPNGRFVYGSNRGHDSIAVYRVGDSGALTLVEHEPTRGKTPRSFTIDPSGRWLIAANQGTDTLAVFAVDGATGALSPVGPLTPVGAPVSVVFVE
jgi:6-phosphogluconolactonase